LRVFAPWRLCESMFIFSRLLFDICGIAGGPMWNFTVANYDIRCLVNRAEWKGWLRGLDLNQRSRACGIMSPTSWGRIATDRDPSESRSHLRAFEPSTAPRGAWPASNCHNTGCKPVAKERAERSSHARPGCAERASSEDFRLGRYRNAGHGDSREHKRNRPYQKRGT